MMQNDTKKQKKTGAVICAAVVVGFLGIFLGTVLFPLVKEAAGEIFAIGFLLIYGGIVVAAIAGVLAALRQRLREIEGGEEEDAKQY